MSAFLAALDEGFCPECLVPLQDRRPLSDLPYCPACGGWWGTSKESVMSGQCPATTRYAAPDTGEITGLQCKYATPHDGDHCATPPGGGPDVFWPQDTAPEAAVETEEDRIRDAMTEAMENPGRVVHR